MEMLKKYPSLALKAMRAKLSQLHGIEMSETALGKIRRAIQTNVIFDLFFMKLILDVSTRSPFAKTP